jgi:hypothetical protein
MTVKKLTVYLPTELAKGLRIACVKQDTTLSSVITDLVENYVAKPFQPRSRDRRKEKAR